MYRRLVSLSVPALPILCGIAVVIALMSSQPLVRAANSPVTIGGPFTLTSPDGTTVTEQAYLGKEVLEFHRQSGSGSRLGADSEVVALDRDLRLTAVCSASQLRFQGDVGEMRRASNESPTSPGRTARRSSSCLLDCGYSKSRSTAGIQPAVS